MEGGSVADPRLRYGKIYGQLASRPLIEESNKLFMRIERDAARSTYALEPISGVSTPISMQTFVPGQS